MRLYTSSCLKQDLFLIESTDLQNSALMRPMSWRSKRSPIFSLLHILRQNKTYLGDFKSATHVHMTITKNYWE